MAPGFDPKVFPELAADSALLIGCKLLESTDLVDLLEPAFPKLSLVDVGVHEFGARPVGRIPSDRLYPVVAKCRPHKTVKVPEVEFLHRDEQLVPLG